MISGSVLNESDFQLLWERIKDAFSYDREGWRIYADSYEVSSGILKCVFVVDKDGQQAGTAVSLNLSGFFRKRKKKGFVYIGRLDSPIHKDSKGNIWIDGKNEFKPFDSCSKRLKGWLSFLLGRQANNDDYLKFISDNEVRERDLNPFDFVFEDIYAVFLREIYDNIYSLREKWVYYFKRYGKIDENILQRYAKKLFKGRFNEFSPVVEQDYVNWIDAIDGTRRIFFLNRKGERIRVNSPHLAGVVYDPIGTSEGALVNQKNKLPDSAEIVGREFYVVYNDKEKITLYDFFSKPVLMLSGKVMQWGAEVNKEPELVQDQRMCLSATSLNIPMINFCDTTRAILSGHMMLQAVPLVYGSPAIIQSCYRTDLSRFFNPSNSKMQYIPSKKGTYNFIEDGIPDTFEPGSLLPRISFPLLTAYMNFWGLEQEDAIVISESAARRLSVYKIKEDILSFVPSSIPDDIIDMEIYCSSDDFSRIPHGMKKFYRGNGNRIIVKKRYEFPVQLGDKITTRYGCKGVVSRIVPDEEMPCLEDGRRIQVIQSPLAVLNRRNIAQYYEALLTHALYFGTKNYDLGRRDVEGFLNVSWNDRHKDLGIAHMQIDPIEKNIGPSVLGEFIKLCGAGDSYRVFVDGKCVVHPVIVGYNEFMRLYFFAEKKFFCNYGNARGGNHPGFRVDEMSLWALMAHDKISLVNSEEDVTRRNEWLKSRLMMSGYILHAEQ